MAFLPPMPGYPGPAFSGRRSMVPPVSLPMMPSQPHGAAAGPAVPAQGSSPFEALAKAGVPVTISPDGRPILRSGVGAGGRSLALPPEIPGMPQMPSPPGWMTTGEAEGGGLFRPLEPVAHFDMSSQVHQFQFRPPQGR